MIPCCHHINTVSLIIRAWELRMATCDRAVSEFDLKPGFSIGTRQKAQHTFTPHNIKFDCTHRSFLGKIKHRRPRRQPLVCSDQLQQRGAFVEEQIENTHKTLHRT